MFSDLAGFIISIISIFLAKKKASNRLSYGYHRAEIIGAMCSVLLIWGMTIWLIIEAADRIHCDFEIDEVFMLGTAVFGLVCNLIMGKILHSSPV
mmetsp:Transcript_57159/g.86317  ORF Transcript_57159/g.86317 Transcript_57159/m.86317 type:complete len:95 (-) Transcript_57159:617-901(-)